MQTCVVCAKPSQSSCSRCELIKYCSRDCQRQHWPTHKLKCFTKEHIRQFNESRYAKFLEHATKRIYGNICIVQAWNAPCTVEITMDETIEEFIRPSSFHIAYLTWTPSATPQIKYILSNYTLTQPDTPPDNPNIKQQNAQPEQNAAVMFNM